MVIDPDLTVLAFPISNLRDRRADIFNLDVQFPYRYFPEDCTSTAGRSVQEESVHELLKYIPKRKRHFIFPRLISAWF
jgi:hypothetical protein